AGCDVFVLSSRNEGMANVMLEAMVTGTPVVAADISGVREVLDARADGPPAGWVVPPDDATSLARALVEVTALIRGGAVEVTRRTVEARRRVEQEMGVDRMIAHVESVLAGSAAAE